VSGSPERFGRYELIAPLGAGGMGEVFLARVRGAARVQKTVVLKRLRQDRLNDEAARARFVDEARVSVSLSHPHVVPVFEFGELDGSYFLVIEWVRGGELQRIAGVDKPPLGWAAVALLGAQLCDALAYLHRRTDRRGQQLVHGDVTPRNVLLSLDGHALLADFGLARFAPRGRAGTRRYLAPEQARGESADGRADLYALALVLCEAATGQPAYDRDPDRAEKQARVGLVPALDGVQADLAAVLRRALAPSRDARFADAAAMRDAFEKVLDEGSAARSTGRAELVARIAASGGSAAGADAGGSTMATRAASSAPAARRLAIAAIVGALLIAGGVMAMRVRRTPPAPPPNANFNANANAVGAAAGDKPPPDSAKAATVAPPPVAPHVSSARSPARAPKPAPTKPAAQPGKLDLNAVPWAHVRIDGTDRGETPLLGLSLEPGEHVVQLTNEPLGVRRELRLTVKPGERREHVEDLTH
jgi:serine/threonine-protein kinase